MEGQGHLRVDTIVSGTVSVVPLITMVRSVINDVTGRVLIRVVGRSIDTVVTSPGRVRTEVSVRVVRLPESSVVKVEKIVVRSPGRVESETSVVRSVFVLGSRVRVKLSVRVVREPEISDTTVLRTVVKLICVVVVVVVDD